MNPQEVLEQMNAKDNLYKDSEVNKFMTKVDKVRNAPTGKEKLENRNMLEFSVPGIIGGGVIGLVTGLALVGGYQISKNVTKLRKHKLDPESPDMEELNPNLADIYRLFMGPYYKNCPDDKKALFQKYVRTSIRLSDQVCVIETQLRNNEIKKNKSNYTEAVAYANHSLEVIRKTLTLFNSDFINVIYKNIQAISGFLMEHLNNIKNLTEYS